MDWKLLSLPGAASTAHCGRWVPARPPGSGSWKRTIAATSRSYASHAAVGESMKRDDADPVLSAELGRLSRADAAHLNGVRTINAIARPDLSHGAYPDLALMRFFEITTFRVRPGHEAGFEAAAKAYAAAARKAGPNAS